MATLAIANLLQDLVADRLEGVDITLDGNAGPLQGQHHFQALEQVAACMPGLHRLAKRQAPLVARREIEYAGRGTSSLKILPAEQIDQRPTAYEYRRVLGEQAALFEQDLGGTGGHHAW